MAVDSAVARANFELANNITPVASVDAVFRYDHEKQQELLSAKPWEKEYVSWLQYPLPLHIPHVRLCMLHGQPPLLPKGADICTSSAQNGDARSCWRKAGGDGSNVRQD